MNGIHFGKYSLDGFQKTAVSLMAALILVTFVASNAQALLWQSSSWLVSTVLPATVVDLTNKERASLSAAPLRRNATLDAAATMKAKHMAKNEYFSHYSPDGVSPWYWFDQSGYVYANAGENLAIHFTDSTEVVDAWMKSPTHRQNIVSAQYTEIGVGTAKGKFDGYDTVYVVQLFGTPGAAAPVKAAPSTPAPTPAPVVATAPAPTPQPVVVATAPVVEVPAPVAVTPVPESAPVVVSTTPAPSEPEITTSSPVEPAPVSPAPVAPEVLTVAEEPTVVAVSEPVSVPDVVTLESSLIATSSGLAVANYTESTIATAGTSAASLATKPNTVLQYAYFLLALIILMLLGTSIVLEARQLRYIQVAYSLGLVVSMGGLWFINDLLTSGAVIL